MQPWVMGVSCIIQLYVNVTYNLDVHTSGTRTHTQTCADEYRAYIVTHIVIFVISTIVK